MQSFHVITKKMNKVKTGAANVVFNLLTSVSLHQICVNVVWPVFLAATVTVSTDATTG